MRTPRTPLPLLRCVIAAVAVVLTLTACNQAAGRQKAEGHTGGGVEVAGPSGLPQGSEPVRLDPARFSARIDNPYWPMRPGARWVYREHEDGATSTIEVTVTNRTRKVAGIDATVVRDVATEDGQVVEDTFDWFAQDDAGNVWYLGEATRAFEDGKVSTEGSWEAGVDGAQAGVVVPAEPRPGMAYRQEYLRGEAEDAGQILSLDEQVQVPVGSFDGVLMTKDFTRLEPNLLEHKFYAKGVGPILALTLSGGSGREELVRYVRPS